MSHSLDRHRMANKYWHGLDAISGDAETTKLLTSLVSEAAQKGGGYIAERQERGEVADKAKKAGGGADLSKPSGKPKEAPKQAATSTWKWVAGGVGALVLGVVGVKLLGGKRRR